MTTDALTFYREHNPFTDPKHHAALFDALPDDMEALHRAINGFIIHNWKIRHHQIEVPLERKHEIEIMGVARMLDAVQQIDPQPLNIKRPRDKRLIIDCRHFSVMLCSVLQHRGIPSRVRCGFATYLEPNVVQDHWITEYWNGERWVQEDPDVCKHDIPHDEFLSASRVWTACRAGTDDPNRFGCGDDIRGMGYILHNVIRDFAALNNMPVLSSDWWDGFPPHDDNTLAQADCGLIDQTAALANAGNDAFDEMRTFYETSHLLRVPDEISSLNYTIWKERKVSWREMV